MPATTNHSANTSDLLDSDPVIGKVLVVACTSTPKANVTAEPSASTASIRKDLRPVVDDSGIGAASEIDPSASTTPETTN